MHRGDRDRPKPGLARAHHPFTPISHKPAKPVETPFQPLRVNDLDTPKVPKIESNSDPIPDADVEPETEFTTHDQEFKALRHALLSCIGILDRMDKTNAEQNQRRSASTQTLSEAMPPAADAHRPPKQFEETEVIVAAQRDPMEPSPVAKVAPPARPKVHARRDEDPRKLPPPTNRNGPPVIDPKAEVSAGSAESASAVEDDGNLQKRLHEMSLLLKRLENQIDGVNDPYGAIE
jgi:hypothetical protein